MKQIYVLIISFFVSLSVSAQHGRYVGGDISLLPAYEKHNSPYLDGEGNPINDLVSWLTNECGWNAFRVRLFVNPDGSDPSVCQDLDYVKALGKRIKDAGANFMLDFHYSDTWADPTKQYLPAAWSDCTTVEAKAEKLYAYTKECLNELNACGATPDFVQVGNEITSGIVDVWRSSNQAGFKQIVERGCDAVREVCPDAKIVIHIERPQNTANVVSFYQALDASKFDVIGLSYYPFWHSSLTALGTTISRLATDFPTKKVEIVETAYNFQYDFDKPSTASSCPWAKSADGQYAFVKDLIAELAKYENVDGLYYWCPEEAGNGDDTNWSTSKGTVMTSWINRGLWWPSNSNGHWPVKGGDGMVTYLMKSFLSAEALAVAAPVVDSSNAEKRFTLSGLPATKSQKGVIIVQGKKQLSR